MGLNQIEASDGGAGTATKSTTVTFRNPEHEDVDNDSEYQDRDWYAAVRWLRKESNGNPQVALGMFAHAAQEADEGNLEPLEELFQEIAGQDL